MKSHLSPSPPLPQTGCDPKPTPPLYTFGSPAANAPLWVHRPRAPPTPALPAGLGQRALLGPSPSLSPQQGHLSRAFSPTVHGSPPGFPAPAQLTCSSRTSSSTGRSGSEGRVPEPMSEWGCTQATAGPPQASDPRSLLSQPGPPTALGALCPRNPHLLSLLLYLSQRAAGLSLKL